MRKCKKHPKYRTNDGKPNYPCPTCWEIWDEKFSPRPKILTPWHDAKGVLHFPIQATESKAFIWPTEPPETLGDEKKILIPKQYRQYYNEGIGILLSIGPGYWNQKGKWIAKDKLLKPGIFVAFDETVPYRTWLKGLDGVEYEVTMCVEVDIGGVVE